MKLLQLVVLAVALLSVGTSAAVVSTISGQVDGNVVQLDDGRSIGSWYGIPYAKPPIGVLRFQPPQWPTSWSNVFDATQMPNACMQQSGSGFVKSMLPPSTKFSEDCLNLNVFAPQDVSGAPYPVMVYFHGGGYVRGSNAEYPGYFLAAKGVIVVVPNYRLGVFGFLSTPDGTVTGNMGMKDQVLALQWVSDNIANFGGNPNNVTIFGQSAGAASVSLHLVSPLSRGLFHRAIMESGSDRNMWTINHPESKPMTFVNQTAAKLSCKFPTYGQIVDCLRSKSASALLAAQDITCPSNFFQSCSNYAPIVDGAGVGRFLPKLPAMLDAEMDARYSVPAIYGITADDGSIYTAHIVQDQPTGGINGTMFDTYLMMSLGMSGSQAMSDHLDNLILGLLKWYYTDWANMDDPQANMQAFNRLFTDYVFGAPWDCQLKSKAMKNPNTYGYVFAFQPTDGASHFPPWMGASHTAEIPYVWGFPKMMMHNHTMMNDSVGMNNSMSWTQAEIMYADYIMTLWTNFAKYGNPTPMPVKSPCGADIVWPKYSLNDHMQILYFDYNTTIVPGYNQRSYALYNHFIHRLYMEAASMMTTMLPTTSSRAPPPRTTSRPRVATTTTKKTRSKGHRKRSSRGQKNNQKKG